MSKLIDLTGHRFSRLIVLNRVEGEERVVRVQWLCGCDCGRLTSVSGSNLKSRHTRSCGCLGREQATTNLASGNARNKTHGRRKQGPREPSYGSWEAMKSRCLNRNASNWDLYGGRGIAVCDRWLTFENFLADMGERPPGTSLDRIDNDGNYEPGNCRWATAKEQRQNRGKSRTVPKRGKPHGEAGWVSWREAV